MSEATAAAVLPEPTQDERTMATLAHALQIVGWFIAPLVIFLIRRDSRFVSFHALQAIFLQLLYMLCWGVFMVAWFGLVFGTVFSAGKSQAGPPPLFFLLFPLVWLAAMGGWVTMLVAAIVYAIKAGRGEWANYPVLGRLARQVLNI